MLIKASVSIIIGIYLGKLFSEVTPFSTILCDSQNLLCQELYERVREKTGKDCL
jgi:hypothetical protein